MKNSEFSLDFWPIEGIIEWKMKGKNMVPAIETFHNMIHKLAYGCWRRLPSPKPMEFEDLISEANLVYVKIVPKYDPDRANFITFFQWAVRNHYAHLVKSAWNNQVGHLEDTEAGMNRTCPKQDNSLSVNELFVESPSVDAQAVVDLLLEPSSDYLEWEQVTYLTKAHKPKILLNRICRFLGMDGKQAENVKNELKRKMNR